MKTRKKRKKLRAVVLLNRGMISLAKLKLQVCAKCRIVLRAELLVLFLEHL